MHEAQALIDEHYARIRSNQSSYEVVSADSEEGKIIAEYNKAKRPGLYK